MIQKSAAIAAVLSATLLGAVSMTTTPFNMNHAEGQILPSCPVGYERNELGTCVPIVDPDPDNGSGEETGTATEQGIGQKNVVVDEQYVRMTLITETTEHLWRRYIAEYRQPLITILN
jgi:hypothetical protein